jgi:biopolymer transport protein ExbD
MADIAFLLMIFFITSTVLRIELGLPVDLPRAQSVMRQPRELIAHVWIDAAGRAMINDLYVAYDDVAPILAEKLRRNPALVVAVNSDRRTPYTYVHRMLEELKKAEAVRISFTAEPRPGS